MNHNQPTNHGRVFVCCLPVRSFFQTPPLPTFQLWPLTPRVPNPNHKVAAHGTGASLPTVEEMILRMKLVTPASGTIELSAAQAPELFQLAKVGRLSLRGE